MKQKIFGFWFDGPGLIIAAPIVLLLWGMVTAVIAVGVIGLLITDKLRPRRTQPQ
jgi:hypothetical protein